MNSNLKLATIVVCWYPDADLIENIASYSIETDLLIVWDNTPGGSQLVDSLQSATILNHGGDNMGLAYSYNRSVELAEQEGATHIMTMDQDSLFIGFSHFRGKLFKYPDAMICPPINAQIDADKNVSHAAQSGCIFPISMIKQIGGFREDFFIGMVDVEMQLRAQEAGYRIIQIEGCSLIHHIGSERKVSLLGHSFAVSDYSPLRHYYDSRNRILMWKEFPHDYSFQGKVKHLLGRLKVMGRILLFEDNKLPKSFAILRGTWNGLFNRIKPF